MTYTTRYRKSWIDVFPPDHLLQDTRESEEPVLVDVGGGAGTDAIEFRRRFPRIRGRVILQELPSVIEMAKESKEMKNQVSESTPPD